MITNIKENLEENLNYEGKPTESINNYLSLSDKTIDDERELLSQLKKLYYDRRAEANAQIIKLKAEVDIINKKLEEL